MHQNAENQVSHTRVPPCRRLEIPRSVWARFSRLVVVFVLFIAATAASSRSASSQSCGKSAAEIFKEISSRVVTVVGLTIDPFDLRRQAQSMTGAGLIVDGSGLVVTNHHVVLGSKWVQVTLDGERYWKADLIAADPVLDIAVLATPIKLGDDTKSAFADSDALEIGQRVFAVGNPLGVGKTLSSGIISGLKRVVPIRSTSWLTPHIQTDAALNPGNSGGPLVDDCGRVVGINVITVPKAQNMGFALPGNLVRFAIEELVAKKRIIRVWHGLYGRMVDPALAEIINIPTVDGFMIETIEPGSPAEKAGLQGGNLPLRLGQRRLLIGGDIITRVNQTDLKSFDTVMAVLGSLKVGEKITFEYYRDGIDREMTVRVPERPVLPGDIRVLRSVAAAMQDPDEP